MTRGRALVADMTPAEVVYRRDYRNLVALATLLTGSLDVSEDLVQDVFVRSGDRLALVEDASTYLRAAVANAARSWHRHQNVVARHASTTGEPVDLPVRLVELHDALQTLTEARRTAIVLRFVAGFDDEEIARLVGCRPATVRSRIHRGLLELRRVIPVEY